MCGICGQYNYGDGAPVDPAHIARMARSIAHRGPDDEGRHVDGALGLGFRRLSIIDLAGGHQPMSDREGAVWVVFNGEIYNFRELRADLESRGHVFRTRSDTETIVHGYKEWGDDVLERLNGMFGLAVWDSRKRRLMLARDRAGVKLVYFKDDGGRLVFGSEIRPILTGERPEIDPVALNLFLRHRFTPSPLTAFRGVRKLAPGTRLIVENGRVRTERWWRYAPEPFDPMPSETEAAERLLELYGRAVGRQLVSDVPLGLLLSGGVDSALLLALMKRWGDEWATYTVGYGEGFADDELADAARTASLLGCPNHGLRLDRNEFEATLAGIVDCLEEPVASSSIVPMYHVCASARRDVKVVLMGQGPDELFGGYRRHFGLRYGRLWRLLPARVRGALGAALSAIPRAEWVRRGLYALGEPDRMRRYQRVLSIAPGAAVDSLFHPGLLPPGAGDAALACWSDLEPLLARTDELGGLQFVELRSTLPDELLMYADKLSMAHGLEVRVPYLDHEIVEYAERLSAAHKVRAGEGKRVHRAACRRFLPREILSRRKRGFAVNVVDAWFRDALAGSMRDALTDPASLIYRFFRPEAVLSLLDAHARGRRDNHKILFSLVLLEEWLRRIDSMCCAHA